MLLEMQPGAKMNIFLNISDHISHIKDLTRLETEVKIHSEVSYILSNKIAAGQLDSTKEHTLFVSTKFGAVTVTLIPTRNFQ